MAAAVTESLPNLNMSSLSKRVGALEPCIHAAFKAGERQIPGVVMKRTDAV